MRRVIVGAAVLMIGTAAVAWSQTQPPVTQPDPANFTGKVVGHPTSDIRMNRYSFEPGGRTNWHSHTAGQVVLIEQGRARVQERGGLIREFAARQTFTAEPGVVHWHGALPNEGLTQVSLSFGATNWMEKVTDEQYAGGRR